MIRHTQTSIACLLEEEQSRHPISLLHTAEEAVIQSKCRKDNAGGCHITRAEHLATVSKICKVALSTLRQLKSVSSPRNSNT